MKWIVRCDICGKEEVGSSDYEGQHSVWMPTRWRALDSEDFCPGCWEVVNLSINEAIQDIKNKKGE